MSHALLPSNRTTDVFTTSLLFPPHDVDEGIEVSFQARDYRLTIWKSLGARELYYE